MGDERRSLATAPIAERPLTNDEIDLLWERWYHDPDPESARLTTEEIARLFLTCWALMDNPRKEQP